MQTSPTTIHAIPQTTVQPTPADIPTIAYINYFNPTHYQDLKAARPHIRTYYIGPPNPLLTPFPEIQQRISPIDSPLSPLRPYFQPFIDEGYSTVNDFTANLTLILSFRSMPYIRFLTS